MLHRRTPTRFNTGLNKQNDAGLGVSRLSSCGSSTTAEVAGASTKLEGGKAVGRLREARGGFTVKCGWEGKAPDLFFYHLHVGRTEDLVQFLSKHCDATPHQHKKQLF